jgi:hypothetical protein
MLLVVILHHTGNIVCHKLSAIIPRGLLLGVVK